MDSTGWPGVLVSAASALVVGGTLLIANQFVSISGSGCLLLGLVLLVLGIMWSRPDLARQFAQLPARVLATVAERGQAAARDRPVGAAKIRPARTGGRCLGSTDGHHRWSRHPRVCMLCGEELPEELG